MSEKNDFGPYLDPKEIIKLGKIQTCIEESNHQKPIDKKKGKIIDFAKAKEKIEANKQK